MTGLKLGMTGAFKQVFDRLPLTDFQHTQVSYFYKLKKVRKLDPPRTFNDKIHWLNLYGNIEQYSNLADKLAVREYVKEKVGEEHLNELLGVFQTADEIDLAKLPDCFVLKATHGCGCTYLCKDKASADTEKINRLARTWLSTNYYKKYRERIYKNIPPQIVAEQYINPSMCQMEYKFMCFNGKALFVNTLIGYGEMDHPYSGDYYNMDWDRMPFSDGPRDPNPAPKPENLQEMIDISESLAEGIPFVRVDLMCENEGILFGEMTFTPQAGYLPFQPAEYDEKLGSLLKLPDY